jgi:hypothetical protein
MTLETRAVVNAGLALKVLLTRIGERTPVRFLHRVNAALNYLEVGRWMRAHGFWVPRRFETREELFNELADRIGHLPILYLEFGVYRGESLRYWSRALRHPASQLHGFDSFVGLPEHWNTFVRAGHFSTDGAVPEINDPRVKFFKGLIEDTLPAYRFPEYSTLFLMLDVDVYSTTAFILKTLAPRIRPGVYIYFDDLSDRVHQLKAFDEYLETSRSRFVLVGATKALSHALFKCVG